MEKLRKSLTGFVVPLLSILLAFVIGAIIMAAMGSNPATALGALFQGAFGTAASVPSFWGPRLFLPPTIMS